MSEKLFCPAVWPSGKDTALSIGLISGCLGAFCSGNYSMVCTDRMFLCFSLLTMFYRLLSSEKAPALCELQVRASPSIVSVFLQCGP